MDRQNKIPQPGNLRFHARDFIAQNPESLQNIPDDDIQHYQKIIVALTETDRIMKEIDKIEI